MAYDVIVFVAVATAAYTTLCAAYDAMRISRCMPVDIPACNITYRKVGGLRFFRFGRLSLSLSLTNKPV